MNKLTIKQTAKFKQGLKLARRQHRNLDELRNVISKLQAREALPAKNRDHQLQGRLRMYRECHVAPDWLLVYRIVEDELVLVLANLGTHAELFKI